MDAAPATKKCPFCSEQILLDAKKCKHCGSPIGSEPPCRQCGGLIVWVQVAYTPGYASIFGILFILGGIVGIPFFGLTKSYEQAIIL